MNKIASAKLLAATMIAILILPSFISLATPSTTVGSEGTEQSELAVALGLIPSEFDLLDATVREYFTEKYPFLLDWTDFPIYYERLRELEDEPGIKMIRVEGRFELPSPTVTFRLHDGQVELVSEAIEIQVMEVQPLQSIEHRDVEIDGDTNPEFIIHWRYSDFPNNDRADEVVAMVEAAARTSWNTICGNDAEQWDFDEPSDDDGTVDIYVNDNVHAWGPPGIARSSTLWTSNGTDDFIFIHHNRQQTWEDDHEVEWPTEQDCFTAGISHEFFHGVQNAYSVLTTGLWIVEGTARFLPSAVNPDAAFYTPQSSSRRSLYIRNAINYLDDPGETLEDKSYDACIYWRYVYEHHGGMDTIRSIFAQIEADNPVTFEDECTSVNAVLGTTDIAFANFATANYLEFSDNPSARDDEFYEHSACYYEDVNFAWNNWWNPLVPIGGDPYVIDDPSPVDPFAADYIRVYFTSFGFNLRSVFEGDSDSSFTIHAVHKHVLNPFTLSPGDTWSGTLYTPISGLIDHVDFIVIRTESGGSGDYELSVVEVQDAEFSIGMGLQWLRAPGRQASDGSWYGDPAVTSFAVLTMLNWGYDETDGIVSKGIDYVLSKINTDGSVHNQPGRYTYYTSIAILPLAALAATGNTDYDDEIEEMRDWLTGSQWDESSFYGSVDPSHWYYGGFGYGSSTRPDLSNTQWALAGLKAADRALDLEATDTYAKAADYFLARCQNADGGSGYTPGSPSWHTMTAASVWSYAMCGRGTSDEALAGIQWLTDDYSLTNNDGNGYLVEYYYKVTLAKALTMTHKTKLGEHDWFEELSEKLADEQLAQGNWPVTGLFGGEIDTCWAIMALQTRTLPPSGVFGMWATLESHCDLHMYDSLGRHTGVNYVTGTVEENIPGSDFKILDADGNEVPYSGSIPDDDYRQVIELSQLVPGSYRIELVGTSDGPYHLTVVGLSDDDQVTTHTFEGTVEEGDRLATSVTVTSMEGALTLLYEPLIVLPVLGVDPAHLDIGGEPGAIAQAAFTASEIGGEETLHDVTIYCTDITGIEGLIDGDGVTFDANDFDLGPGESQTVNASIPVPIDFKGPGTGSIIVESIDGGTREITLTLWTTLTATIDFVPDVLNREAKGKYVTAYIELPTGHDVSQIDVSSIRLNDTVAALTNPTEIDDYDSDGIPDLMVKFDRAAVQDAVTLGAEVGAIVTGEVAGIGFEGTDTITRVIAPEPPGHAAWTRVTTPTTEGFVLAPDSVIVDYAVTEDGAAAYAILYSYNTSQFHLLKSTDGAATWEDAMAGLEEEADGDIDWLVDVATDAENSDFVAVALEMTDSSVHVFISDDGGATFEDAGEVEDGGVYFPNGYDVSDIEVSPEVGGNRSIAIGGSDNYGDAALFRCMATGDAATAWEDATDYVGWDDNSDFTSILLTDIIFSPSWETDKTILVTTVADYGPYYVHLQCGSWGTTPGWNDYSTLGIEAVPIIEDVDIPIWLADFQAGAIAGMTVPSDYNSKDTNTRVLWVWVNYYDEDEDDYPACVTVRVDDDSASPLIAGEFAQVDGGDVWLTNISYKGTIEEGEAVAGVLGTGTYDPVHGSPNDLITECCEGVQVYRHDGIHDMDICCERWHDACKPPTGTFATAVSYVGEDKTYAVSLWGFFSPYDEDAWSVSFDDGDTWNQLSLIDTRIDYISDVAVSPDCNKTMLASVNEESGCECDSVWLHAETLPEAPEYSGKWLRTWCGQLEGDIGEGWERGLLRLAPEETAGDTMFLVDYGTSNLYRLYRGIYDVDCWDAIGCPELDYIVDLAAQDADTLYALDYYGDVAMFDDDEWEEAVTSEVDYGWTIAVHGDHILVGGCDGDVSYSEDGGETFAALEDVPAVAADYTCITVAFDSYFDANDTIYAAAAGFVGSNPATGGIYRWVIGESEEWQDLGAEDYAYTGLVLNAPSGDKPETSPDTGGVLYASYVSGVTTGAARCLTPAEDRVRRIKWDYLTNGLTSELFKMMPRALKVCGGLTTETGSKLFAIDSSDYYNMESGMTGTAWSFQD